MLKCNVEVAISTQVIDAKQKTLDEGSHTQGQENAANRRDARNKSSPCQLKYATYDKVSPCPPRVKTLEANIDKGSPCHVQPKCTKVNDKGKPSPPVDETCKANA